MPSRKQPSKSTSCSASLTVPELEQSKTAVLDLLASAHSRRSYKHAIEKFIAWYYSEPRLGFNRSAVVRYRSFLEGLSLAVATINLHLSAIRRLADEAAESGWLSAELAFGIRRVKGAKRIGIDHLAPHDLRRYAVSRIMPNRNLRTPEYWVILDRKGERIRHYRGPSNRRNLSLGRHRRLGGAQKAWKSTIVRMPQGSQGSFWHWDYAAKRGAKRRIRATQIE